MGVPFTQPAAWPLLVLLGPLLHLWVTALSTWDLISPLPIGFWGFPHCPEGRGSISLSADPTDLSWDLSLCSPKLCPLGAALPPHPDPHLRPHLPLPECSPSIRLLQVLPVPSGAVPFFWKAPHGPFPGRQASSTPLSPLSLVLYPFFLDQETLGREDYGVGL